MAGAALVAGLGGSAAPPYKRRVGRLCMRAHRGRARVRARGGRRTREGQRDDVVPAVPAQRNPRRTRRSRPGSAPTCAARGRSAPRPHPTSDRPRVAGPRPAPAAPLSGRMRLSPSTLRAHRPAARSCRRTRDSASPLRPLSHTQIRTRSCVSAATAPPGNHAEVPRSRQCRQSEQAGRFYERNYDPIKHKIVRWRPPFFLFIPA